MARRNPNQVAQARGSHHASSIRSTYRCGTLLATGITVAGSSDAPYSDPDPWAAMRSARDRRSGSGVVLGEDHSLDDPLQFVIRVYSMSEGGLVPRTRTTADEMRALAIEDLATALDAAGLRIDRASKRSLKVRLDDAHFDLDVVPVAYATRARAEELIDEPHPAGQMPVLVADRVTVVLRHADGLLVVHRGQNNGAPGRDGAMPLAAATSRVRDNAREQQYGAKDEHPARSQVEIQVMDDVAGQGVEIADRAIERGKD